ncbi:MAG: hypothetical protein ACPL1Y_06820, partial [Thermoplasmata archaeon]
WKKASDFSDTILNENGAWLRTRNPGPVINEVCPVPNGWVEVYNPDGINLTGYYIVYGKSYYNLSGGTDTYQVVEIPNLKANKTVSLYNSGDVQIDSITPTEKGGVSYIRYPDGGTWYGWTATATRGAANVQEFEGFVFILPIMLVVILIAKRRILWRRRNAQYVEQE